MSPNYSPLSYLDEYNDEFSGMDVEILNWIAENQGININFESCYISEYEEAIKTKKIDMMCAMTIREERKDKVDFSTPYLSGPFEIIAKSDSAITVDDVKSGKVTIACQYGSAQEKWVISQLGEDEFDKRVANGDILQCLSTDAAVVNVLLNNADVAIVSKNVAGEMVKEYIMVKIIGSVNGVEYTAYGISKNEPKLLEKINAGLDNLMNSPDWQVMLEKYNFA